jgi:hypothetical protein
MAVSLPSYSSRYRNGFQLVSTSRLRSANAATGKLTQNAQAAEVVGKAHQVPFEEAATVRIMGRRLRHPCPMTQTCWHAGQIRTISPGLLAA